MQSMKKTAANVGASAKAGMEKTKATAQEKVEKMSAHDPIQKEMATQKKEERMAEAERSKHEARWQNAAASQAASIPGGHGHYTASGTGEYGTTGKESHTRSTSGAPGYPMGTQQMSAMPGHGTGQPYGGTVDEGVVGVQQPMGMPGATTGHNTHVEGSGFGLDTTTPGPGHGAPTHGRGYGTGGRHS